MTGALSDHGLEDIAVSYGLRFPVGEENLRRQFGAYDVLYAWRRPHAARTP